MPGDIERIYSTLLDHEYQRELFGDLEGFEEKDNGYIARCPFHEDTLPTLLIYKDRPEYFCFACSAGGDWLRYMQMKEGLSFNDALSKLSIASGIDPREYTRNSWDNDLSRTTILETALSFFIAQLYSPPGDKVLQYLYNRRYSMSEVEGSSFGYYPGIILLREYLISQGISVELLDKILPGLWNTGVENHNLVIPFRDFSGRLMGLYGRDITRSGEHAYTPLTDMSGLKDVPFLMYKFRQAEELIIVDGLFDALLIDRNHVKPVVSIGKSGLSEGQADTISKCSTKRVILALGSGDDQKKATVDAIDLLSAKGLSITVVPLEAEYSDMDDFIRSTSISDFRKLLKKTRDADDLKAQNRS